MEERTETFIEILINLNNVHSSLEDNIESIEQLVNQIREPLLRGRTNIFILQNHLKRSISILCDILKHPLVTNNIKFETTQNLPRYWYMSQFKK